MTDAPQEAQRPCVMVVDDAATVRRFHRQMLETAGCRVIEAGDGVEGLEQALMHDVRLILVDVNMPEMDGYTFLRRLREDPRVGATPAVMISTEARPRDLEEALAAGANLYLVKPVRPERLRPILRIMATGSAR
jgi:two-component system chemotaxis response regulator CheY